MSLPGCWFRSFARWLLAGVVMVCVCLKDPLPGLFVNVTAMFDDPLPDLLQGTGVDFKHVARRMFVLESYYLFNSIILPLSFVCYTQSTF